MSLIDRLASILQRSEYNITRLSSARPSLCFEDETILGLAIEFASANDLLHQWQTEQDAFLQRNALVLRRAGVKSWNVYCVFLSSDGLPQDASSAALVEEDFRGARKIAAVGLSTDEDIVRAILPLLPIQNVVQTREENVRELLLQRLDLPTAAKALIGDGASPSELVKILASGT